MRAESRLDLVSYRGSGRPALGACLAALFGLVLPGVVLAQVITEFTVPGQPYGIVAGPDGALWFTEYSGNKIGRFTTSGVVTEFPIPTSNAFPWEIAAGPDGDLLVTENGGNKIGRITTGGVITEFSASGGPEGIAAGPDGALWFTESNGNKIGRISSSGLILVFTIPTANSSPESIAAGADGNLWFAEGVGKIGRITRSGVFAEFSIPTASSGPIGITAGPDGNLWFAEINANKIGRITTSGVFAEFPVPTSGGAPIGITDGPGRNLMCTEQNRSKIGRITTSGVIAEFPVPASGGLHRIAAGPDGNLWYTNGGDKIGRVQIAVSRVIPVAISSPGAFGSFFKTAVQINNPSAEPISGKFTFHSGGGSGSASDPSMTVTIAPGQTVSYPDILPAMGLSAVGTMDLVLPVGDRVPSPIATVRLYNDGGAAGTSGFTEDLIDPYGERVLQAGATGYLLGPADPSRFRYNIGLRTLSSGASLKVTVHASDGTVIRTVSHSYPPTHFEQTDAASFLGGALGSDQSIEISIVSGSAIIYGATADNTTNDSSIQFVSPL